MVVKILILWLIPHEVLSIWPIPYDVNLHQEQTFEIDLSDDPDEDEMIKDDMRLTDEDNKLSRLHRITGRSNKEVEEEEDWGHTNIKFPEENFDLEDPIPWQGGFVDPQGNFIHPVTIPKTHLHQLYNHI